MTTENACEDSWDDEGGGGEEGEEEPDSRRIDNGATVPNDNQNLGKASRQSSRRPSEETHLVLGGGERSGEGMSIRREQSESQNEGNEVRKYIHHRSLEDTNNFNCNVSNPNFETFATF